MNKQEIIEKWEKEVENLNNLVKDESHFLEMRERFWERLNRLRACLEDLKQLNEDIRVPPSESDSVCPYCSIGIVAQNYNERICLGCGARWMQTAVKP